MSFVNFADVKRDYPIDKVATRLGLHVKYTAGGSQLRGPCPSGEGDERSLVITPSKGAWFSFAKEVGGDVIALVAFVRGCPPKEAAKWIVSEDEPVKEEKETPTGFKPLDYLEAEHPAVQSLGFEAEDAARFGIGYCPRGIYRGKVAVPLYYQGKLVGYIGVTDAALPPKWS